MASPTASTSPSPNDSSQISSVQYISTNWENPLPYSLHCRTTSHLFLSVSPHSFHLSPRIRTKIFKTKQKCFQTNYNIRLSHSGSPFVLSPLSVTILKESQNSAPPTSTNHSNLPLLLVLYVFYPKLITLCAVEKLINEW